MIPPRPLPPPPCHPAPPCEHPVLLLCWAAEGLIKGRHEEQAWAQEAVLMTQQERGFCSPLRFRKLSIALHNREVITCDIPPLNYNGKEAMILLPINKVEPSHLPCGKGRQVDGFCGLFKAAEPTSELSFGLPPESTLSVESQVGKSHSNSTNIC